jgi:endonuclease-3
LTAKPKTAAERKARLDKILSLLDVMYPNVTCELHHETAWQLLVATILSAQCTDKRVNMVTPALFARYPTPADLASANPAELEEMIKSTGFFRNKAKSLIGAARRLVEAFGGQVPREMDALLSLPGVARKTANVVRGECFGLADGVVVDTHVTRLSRRMGLTRHTDPVKIERDLMELLPQKDWIAFSHRMIRLGRTVCTARNPACPTCPVAFHCPKIGVVVAAR